MLEAARKNWPWAALPLAAVMAVDPSGLAPFGPLKWMLVPTLVLLGLLSYSSRTRVTNTTKVLGVFVAWTAFTAVFAVDGLYAWTGTPERHFGVIAWVLVLLAWTGGRALERPAQRLVVAACALTAGLMGAWVTAEAFGWEPIKLVGIGDRPVGPLGSSAFLGAAAVLLTPTAMGWAMHTRDRTQRIAAIAASALGLVALAASGARAAWFGAAVVAVVALIVVRQRRLVAGVVVGCAIAGVGIAALTGVAGRASSVATDENGGAGGRLDEWRVALRVIADHPVIGTGPEGYRIAFGHSVDAHYEIKHGRAQTPDRAHSALLDVAATTGLPGLALYVAALGIALLGAVRTLRDGPPWLAGAAVGVIAYFAQSLFLFPIAELEPVAWLLAGLCVAQQGAPAKPHSAIKWVAAGLAATTLIAGALDVVSDRRAKRTLEAVSADAFTTADATTLRPDQVRYWLVRARQHESDGSTRGIQRAIADVEHARDVSPRDPVARQEESRLLLLLARRSNAPRDAKANARRFVERLAKDDPNNAEVQYRLGIARQLTGDQTGADNAFRRATQLGRDAKNGT